MPTLYTMPGTCSLSPNIAVAWLDAPVEIHNIPYGDQKKDYYLAINPRGQVPALRFEDGDVLTEATAPGSAPPAASVVGAMIWRAWFGQHKLLAIFQTIDWDGAGRRSRQQINDLQQHKFDKR